MTNLGTTSLTNLRVTDPQLGLVDAELPVASGPSILGPGEQAMLFHHAVAGERTEQVNSIISAQPVDAAGNPVEDLASPTGVDSPGAVGVPASTPPAADSAAAAVTTSASEGMTEVPATRANGEVHASDGATPAATAVAESDETPTELAMTGVRTEPWILVILALGLILIGYTAYTAFSRPVGRDLLRGHALLDRLGFD